MKRWTLLSAVLAVCCSAMGLRAEEKKITYFGAIEYLTYSDAFKEAEDAKNKLADSLESFPFISDVTTDKKTTAGAGVRIGALIASPVKGLQFGGSLGYILGPRFKGTVNDVDSLMTPLSPPLSEKTQEKIESNLWRLMAESKYSVPLGEKFQARLGFAIGVANLKIKDTKTYENSEGFSESTSKSISTTKLTWEIGPAIAYVTKKVGVELALTYAQMPTAEDKHTFQQFKWNPFGIRLGVEF